MAKPISRVKIVLTKFIAILTVAFTIIVISSIFILAAGT
jgi:ABC-type transport system involved in multi-copper enzyme maturation permease subunit